MIEQQALEQAFLFCLRTNRVTPATATPQQLHDALSRAVMSCIAPAWEASEQKKATVRRAHYFSAEFLVGRAIYNNLLCLGLTQQAEQLLEKSGASLSSLEEIEDAALGNGGLGRLAACFLDSAATLDLPLDGYGIRYRYGLFRQTIEDGFQKEQVDDWARFGDPWSVRCDADAVTVTFADQTVTAVPYDMPVIGYATENTGTLRLWEAHAPNAFDFTLFNDQHYDKAVQESNRAADISRVLYPNDSTTDGKKLRLRQQYFFSSASLQDILRRHKAAHATLENLADYHAVQLNDTHPVIAIPELIRLLVDEHGMTFEQAWEISSRVFQYTNHTVMGEALEKWDKKLVKSLLPRVAEIIDEIDRLLAQTLAAKKMPKKKAAGMAIVQKGIIHMANLAIFGSAHVNGVAQLHSDILISDLFADWYALWPERFCNKTNGITQRRWLALANPELSALVTRLAGNNDWMRDLSKLRELERYADDTGVLEQFRAIKLGKKQDLARFVKGHDGIDINPAWILDVQIKRLHEYKRQLLNILAILALSFEIKEGRLPDFAPTVFLFGAKSAPGYDRAKGIIKLIGEVAALIERDETVRQKMQVVFVANYNVSYAEKIIAAADVSEQISTAGTEASGTGNMKLMLNGAVTLGTYDGANVEIVAQAGRENNYIFGATVEEIAQVKDSYDPVSIYQQSPRIKRVLDCLIDGTLNDGGSGIFKELHDSILKGASWHKPDQYRLLLDFDRYLDAKIAVNRDFGDAQAIARKGWLNLCRSGEFSSDRTIAQYAKEIWQIEPLAR